MPASVGPVRKTLGILLIVAGGVGFLAVLVTSLLKMFGGLQRIEVPGTREIPLEPGSYTIFWETNSRFHPAAARADLDLGVASKDGTVRPSIHSSGWSSRYSTMDRVGVSLASFTVERQDVYVVTAAAAAGKILPKGGLSIGRSMGILGVFRLVAVCLAILAAGLGPGLALLLLTPKGP